MFAYRKLLLSLVVVSMVIGGCRKDAPTDGPSEEQPPVAEVTKAPEAPQDEDRPKRGPRRGTKRHPPPGESQDEVPVDEGEVAQATGETDDSNEPAPAKEVAAPVPTPRPVQSNPVLMPDVRLLLTVADVDELARGKTALTRSPLAGVPTSDSSDSLIYVPNKGSAYGLGIQIFGEPNPSLARDRFVGMLASYPSTQEISSVAGRTFFADWEDILYLGFVQPNKNMVIVLSCGRTYCTSDQLYELARKVASRSGS